MHPNNQTPWILSLALGSHPLSTCSVLFTRKPTIHFLLSWQGLALSATKSHGHPPQALLSSSSIDLPLGGLSPSLPIYQSLSCPSILSNHQASSPISLLIGFCLAEYIWQSLYTFRLPHLDSGLCYCYPTGKRSRLLLKSVIYHYSSTPAPPPPPPKNYPAQIVSSTG